MHLRRHLLALPLSLACASGSLQAVIKADNTSNLNLAAAWAGGLAPTSSDIAEWSGAYNTAGSLSATFTASTPVSWQGVTVGNITGTAAGLVSIGGTGNAATGSSVTIGSSGIDMSGANQNLVINSATTVLTGATQTWNVATGRNIRFGITGTGSVNANLDGAAGTVVTVSGGGVVDLNQGGAAGFTDAAGFAGFNGKWIVNASTTLRGIRNGATAWGTNTAADTIKLNGGTLAVGGISGSQGNWTWNTNITVSASSIIDNQNFSGSGRSLKLNGVITGSSGLTFASTGAGTMSADTGFILTATNTLSGTVTLNSGTFVRVGGINGTGGTDITTTVGSTGDLGTASIVNNGTLTLSRDNTWTFANDVSGTGILRIGINTGSATHIVTVSGNNSHSGGTTLQSAVTLKLGSTNALGNGPFTIAGNGIFDNATGSSLSVSNTLTMSGGSPTFTGTNDMSFGGAALISGAATRTLTVNASSLTLAGGTAEDVAGRNLTKAGAGTLILSGTGAHTGTTNVNAGTLILAGGSAIADTAAVTLANTAGVFLQLNASETVGNLSGGGTTGGTVAVGSHTLTVNSASGVQILGAALTGTGSLIKEGAGALTLEGVNPFSGTITVNNGALAFRGVDSENGSPAIVLGASGQLALGAGFVGQTATISALSGSGTVTPQFDATVGTKTLGVSQSADTVFSGTLTDAPDLSNRLLALAKSGVGSLTLSGNNSYSGGTTLSTGTLVAGSATAFGSGNITVDASGTLDLNGKSIANSVTNNGGTILGAAGNASITQSGGTLSGSIGGTVNASGSVAGSSTIIGTLKGGATFTGAVTIGATGIHAPGNSPGIETFSAGITYANGSTLEIEFVGDTLAIRGTDFDGVDVTGGNLSVTAGAVLKLIDLGSAISYASTEWDAVRAFTIVDNSGGGTTSGDFTLDTSFAGSFGPEGSWSVLTSQGAGGDTVLTWTPVPEPSTYAALAGLLALGLALRRRSK